MATIYVDSNAAGANDGSSWTDAYASIASATGAGASDAIKCEYRHSQNPAASTTYNFSNGTLANPVKIVSCDKDDGDAPRVGAAWANNNNLVWQGHLVTFGLSLSTSGGNIQLAAGSDSRQVWTRSTLTCTSSGGINMAAGTRTRNVLIEPTISSAGANLGVTVSAGAQGTVYIRGGSYAMRSAAAQTTGFTLNHSSLIDVQGLLCTNTCTNLAGTNAAGGSLVMRRCVLPTYTNIVSAAPTVPQFYVLLEQCAAAGTLTVPPLGIAALQSYAGLAEHNLSVYRTGGATDNLQANPASLKLVTNANAIEQFGPLTVPVLTRWVAAGSYTITIYVQSGATLNNDDLWVDITYPDEGGTPTAQASFVTTAMDFLATPAALDTDSSGLWNGSGGGTYQKIEVGISPAIAGLVRAEVNFAKPSTTAYIDAMLSAA